MKSDIKHAALCSACDQEGKAVIAEGGLVKIAINGSKAVSRALCAPHLARFAEAAVLSGAPPAQAVAAAKPARGRRRASTRTPVPCPVPGCPEMVRGGQGKASHMRAKHPKEWAREQKAKAA